MPSVGEFAAGAGFGAAAAAGNFLLSVAAAKFASTKSAAEATGITLLSMGIRLPMLAWFFYVAL